MIGQVTDLFVCGRFLPRRRVRQRRLLGAGLSTDCTVWRSALTSALSACELSATQRQPDSF